HRVLLRAHTVISHVVDATHVRMRHLPGQMDLALEALERIRIAPIAPHFECHVGPQLQVASLVDLTHSAMSEQTHDAIATADHVVAAKQGVARLSPRSSPCVRRALLSAITIAQCLRRARVGELGIYLAVFSSPVHHGSLRSPWPSCLARRAMPA